MPQSARQKAPWTWSPSVGTGDRIVVNPEETGVTGIPVLGVNRARNMSDGAMPHRHRAVEITVCERGTVKFDADGRAWTLLPGMAFVTQPGDVHRLRSNTRGSVLRWIFVVLPERGGEFLGLDASESSAIAKAVRSLKARLYRLPSPAQRLLADMLDGLERRDGADPLRRLGFRTDAVRFLLSMVDAAPVAQSSPKESRLYSVISRMRREPEGRYPVETLIAETGMSETSLLTAFKRETGFAPHEFLVTCRIRKAMDELSSGRCASITDLAISLGFSSSQHFAARFRRETGKTPTEWRTPCG